MSGNSEQIAIKVDGVSKLFKLPHEKYDSVKSIFLNFYKRKKSFESQMALNNVSFEIKKGEFFGIVGRNGSGKSTLLKILAGIYTPTSGSVKVNGSLVPFIELGVGFNPELTGRENVFLNGALLGFNRKEVQAMYKDIVEFAELEKFMDQKLKNYSSGMQVRLGFSIAICAQGDILLLDEVLAVGDAAFQQKCFNYFEGLKRERKTVIFVSHDMASVRRFCTRAVYIEDGNLMQQGPPSDIADTYMLKNIQSAGPKEKNEGLQSKVHSVSAKISEQSNDEVVISVNYKSKTQDRMYVGLALIKEGVSIGGIATSLEEPIKQSGHLKYHMSTTTLNAGLYHIGVGLFDVKNGRLLSAPKDKPQFLVKGDDPRRDSALKLPDTWEYK